MTTTDQLYRLPEGLARRDGDELAVLDLPHRDLADLFDEHGVDGGWTKASAARVTKRVALSEARPLAPLPRTVKAIIVGLNYASHAAETGNEAPKWPFIYVVPGTAVIGPDDPIKIPSVAPNAVDFEGEVGVVIGKAATSVAAEHAWDHVAGMCAVNDVTARDVQQRAFKNPGIDIARSKGFDSFKPVGPCIARTDTDRFDVGVRTRVNGEERQNGRTTEFFFGVPELIEYISQYCTLLPGDVICTGSPAGIGAIDGRYLKAGDVVEIEVEGLPLLRNHVAHD